MNFRSFSAGLALGAAAVLAIAASSESDGRYQATAGTNHVYVIDTRTGQLWLRQHAGTAAYLGTNDEPRYEPRGK